MIAYFLARGAVHCRIGRAWRAVRDNEAAATAMGVSVWRVKAGAFTVSSAFAGLAGVMTALWLDLVKPDENEFTGTYSLTVAIAFLAIVIIGGLGSVPGAVFGAIVVYGLQQFFLLGANQFGWFADAELRRAERGRAVRVRLRRRGGRRGAVRTRRRGRHRSAAARAAPTRSCCVRRRRRTSPLHRKDQ